MKLNGIIRNRRKNRLYKAKCVSCRKDISQFGSKPSKFCSEKCRKEYYRKLQSTYRKSMKGKLMAYKNQTYNMWKDKPYDFLLLRWRQTEVRFKVIERILNERDDKK